MRTLTVYIKTGHKYDRPLYILEGLKSPDPVRAITDWENGGLTGLVVEVPSISPALVDELLNCAGVSSLSIV